MVNKESMSDLTMSNKDQWTKTSDWEGPESNRIKLEGVITQAKTVGDKSKTMILTEEVCEMGNHLKTCISTLTRAECIYAAHHELSQPPMTSTSRKEELRTRSNIHQTPHFKLQTAPDFFNLPSSINTHPTGLIYRYTSFVPLAHPSVFQEQHHYASPIH